MVNIFLLAASVVAYFYVGATMPASAVNELGAEQWPQVITLLLMVFIVMNIVRQLKEGKDGKLAQSFKDFLPSTVVFFKSKLFIGMFILVSMSLLYEPLGFMPSCLLFLIAYGYLLGERRWGRLIASSVIITAILYIGFAVLLGVMLPRGNIAFLRDFALFIESLIPNM